ncbi:MAG TPA: GIY-YIG nuclease family protein [Hyphomicrobium sp.]|nr:GIY-YIG nuclease family protein [Hyphomicrobium sp.]
MKHCVYALIDPRSDGIFYIGQTSDLARRRAEHIEGTDQLSGLVVRQIRLAGFLPLLVVLERCESVDAALRAEIFWIELMISRGMELLNAQAVGGAVERRATRRALNSALEAMAGEKADAADLARIADGRPRRAGEAWSATERRRLAGMGKTNMSTEAMADALERLPGEIRRELAKSAGKGKRRGRLH